MDNQNMSEMSMEDQRKVRGGDWIDTTLTTIEFISLFLGTL
jgi:hypothetical protein